MNRIRTVLNEKGMSQTALAAKLGKTFFHGEYVHHKQGVTANFPLLYQIAEILLRGYPHTACA